jgi:hypothetical protein
LNNFEKNLTKPKLNTLDKLGCNLDIIGKPLTRRISWRWLDILLDINAKYIEF